MKLWIEPAVLAGDSKHYLAPQALYFCLSAQQEGYELATDTSALTKQQRRLLEYEIQLGDFTEDATELYLVFDKSEGQLVVWKEEQILAKGYDFESLHASFQQGAHRTAIYSRTTNETDISITLDLDGTGKSEIKTGLNFFDHMLDQIARHGFIDLTLNCDGDLEVDEHHTIEDVAIALGETISDALGDKKGIERYSFVLAMDEAQATVALDLSGRPYLVFDAEFTREYVGDLPTEMVKHFFYSLAMHLKATLHLSVSGENDHHKIEALFKGFARTLKTAVEKNPRIKHQIPSSKGAL